MCFSFFFFFLFSFFFLVLFEQQLSIECRSSQVISLTRKHGDLSGLRFVSVIRLLFLIGTPIFDWCVVLGEDQRTNSSIQTHV